jgi:uncharacterized protein YkwD
VRVPKKAECPDDGIDDVMRKPLVVACVAAATLAAGGLTATALAQQSPDAPDVPEVRVVAEPALPELDEMESPSPSPSLSSPAPSRRAVDRVSQSPASKPSTESPKNRDKGPDEKPRPRRAAGPAPAAGDVLAAAKAEVTARDISDSPAAPVQQQVLALVNRNRASAGCGALTADRRLIEAANRHAADMARRGYFAHEDRRGDRAGSRVADAGYEWKRYGENIARGQKSPFEVVSDWMNSPQHRENILDCRLDQMGVGLAIDGDDTTYWVQDFATPR